MIDSCTPTSQDVTKQTPSDALSITLSYIEHAPHILYPISRNAPRGPKLSSRTPHRPGMAVAQCSRPFFFIGPHITSVYLFPNSLATYRAGCEDRWIYLLDTFFVQFEDREMECV